MGLDVLLYNGLMLATLVAGLAWLTRHRTPRQGLGVLALGAAVAVWAAIGFGRRFFPTAGLAAYGLFIYAPVFLLGVGWLLRRNAPRRAIAAVVVALLAIAAGVDGFGIEPTWLEVTHREIVTPRVTQPVRIVVIADLQTDRIGPYERSVLDRALDEQPDLLLFAGDYLDGLDGASLSAAQADLKRLLTEVQPDGKLAAFAVKGNVDSAGWAEVFDNTPVRTVHHGESFTLGQVVLTCLALEQSYDTGLVVNRPREAEQRFHLVLGHVPNFALGEIDAELLLAGHTHGGQVRLPMIGPLITLCAVPRSWAAGMTQLESTRRLIVSRGIGMERGRAPRVRFLCRPELVVIDVLPTDAHGGPGA